MVRAGPVRVPLELSRPFARPSLHDLTVPVDQNIGRSTPRRTERPDRTGPDRPRRRGDVSDGAHLIPGPSVQVGGDRVEHRNTPDVPVPLRRRRFQQRAGRGNRARALCSTEQVVDCACSLRHPKVAGDLFGLIPQPVEPLSGQVLRLADHPFFELDLGQGAGRRCTRRRGCEVCRRAFWPARSRPAREPRASRRGAAPVPSGGRPARRAGSDHGACPR